MKNYDLVVLDFETTGLSPAQGHRPIEIGAVLLRKGKVIDQFQSLMNPGFRVSGFIENYTGISNTMLSKAKSCETVMEDFADFIGDLPLVAHNASFDSRFLIAELDRVGRFHSRKYACTMLNSRRIFPDAPNHKLETLVQFLEIKCPKQFHRALADAQMAGEIWLCLEAEIRDRIRSSYVPFDLMQKLGKIPKYMVDSFLLKHQGR